MLKGSCRVVNAYGSTGAEKATGPLTGASFKTRVRSEGVGAGKLYVGVGNAKGGARVEKVVGDGNANGSSRGGMVEWVVGDGDASEDAGAPKVGVYAGVGKVVVGASDTEGSDGAPKVGWYAGGGRVGAEAGKLDLRVEKLNVDAGAGIVVVGAGKSVAEVGKVAT